MVQINGKELKMNVWVAVIALVVVVLITILLTKAMASEEHQIKIGPFTGHGSTPEAALKNVGDTALGVARELESGFEPMKKVLENIANPGPSAPAEVKRIYNTVQRNKENNRRRAVYAKKSKTEEGADVVESFKEYTVAYRLDDYDLYGSQYDSRITTVIERAKKWGLEPVKN